MAVRNTHTVNKALAQELARISFERRRGHNTIALAIGVSRATVANMLAARQGIRLSQFLDWCDFLEVDPADVVTRVAEKTRL